MKRLAFCCLLAAALVGCENDLSTPGAITLQTRKAVEVLPADARFVGRVDLQAVRHNDVLDPFDGQRTWGDELNGELAARLQDFVDATGFDPAEDLREVYVAASGEAPSLVAYADYDRDRLEAYVDERLADDFTRDTYRGVTVYRAREDGGDGKAFYVALASDNMIVASPDAAALEAMLDRAAGQGEALAASEAAMRLVRQVGDGDVWAVVLDLEGMRRPDHDADAGHGDAAFSKLGGLLRTAAVSMRVEDDGVEGDAWLTPRDGVAAGDVASLVRGAVAAAKAAPDLDAAKTRALDEVEVRESGEGVRVSFDFDNAVFQTASR